MRPDACTDEKIRHDKSLGNTFTYSSILHDQAQITGPWLKLTFLADFTSKDFQSRIARCEGVSRAYGGLEKDLPLH